MAVSLIQQITNTGIAVTELDTTIPLTNPRSLLVVCVAGTLSNNVSSIDASIGGTNTQTFSSAQKFNTASVSIAIWYLANSNSANDTIRVFLTASDTIAVNISEWAGAATASVLGGVSTASGSSANPTSGTSTPTSTSDLFVACSAYIPTTSTVSSQSSGWTSLTGANASTTVALIASYKTITDGSTQSDTWTLTPAVATSYASVSATFLPLSTISKFYLHDAASTDAGTLPSTKLDAATADVTATGASTNRTLNSVIGTSQTSSAITTLAQTAAQAAWFRRFCSNPIAAQTFARGVQWAGASSQSSTNSVLNAAIGVFLWRPSTGSSVGTLYEGVTTVSGLTLAAPGTTETAASSAGRTLSTLTAQDGDIIVVELWRVSTSQSMATAYTNTVFYDGTTEASTTSNAAYVLFDTAIVMQQSGLTLEPRYIGQAVKRASIY